MKTIYKYNLAINGQAIEITNQIIGTAIDYSGCVWHYFANF